MDSTSFINLMKELIINTDETKHSELIKILEEYPKMEIELPQDRSSIKFMLDIPMAKESWKCIEARTSNYWSRKYYDDKLIPLGYSLTLYLGVVVLGTGSGLIYILGQDCGCMLYYVLSPELFDTSLCMYIQ